MCRPAFLLILSILGLLSASLPGAARAATPPPYFGYYTVLHLNYQAPLDTSVFARPVDGVFIWVKWSDLEPRANQYDFSQFDQAVALALQNGKKITLGVVAGGDSPDWLRFAPYDVGRSNFIFSPHGGDAPCQYISVPWPWDTKFQDAYAAMMQALSAHLHTIPGAYADVVNVKLTGIDIVSEEFRAPSWPGGAGPVCTQSNDVEIWIRAGYTPVKVIGAAKVFITATARAFPNSLLSLAILADGDFPLISNTGKPLPNQNDPRYIDIKGAVVAFGLRAFPGRFAVNTTGLTAFPQPAVEQTYGQEGAIMGYQGNEFLGTAGGSGCGVPIQNGQAKPCTAAGYLQILLNGVTVGGVWTEVWPPNVASYPTDIVKAEAALLKQHGLN